MKVLGLIVLVMAIGGILWNRRPTTPDPGNSKHPTSMEGSSPTSSDKSLEFPLHCDSGKNNHYRFDYVSEGSLSNFKVSPDGESLTARTDLKFGGNLSLVCIQNKNDRTLWYMKFSLDSFHQQSLSDMTFDKSELQEAVAFEWDKKQGITSIFFPESISRESKFVFFDYLSHLSFKWLQSPSQIGHWKSKQDLNSGKKEFDVAVSRDGDTMELSKKFIGTTQGEKYDASYHFNLIGRMMQSFNLVYSQKNTLQTGALLINNTNIHMKWTSKSYSPNHLLADFKKLERQEFSKFLEIDTIKRIYKNELGDLTASDLLNKLGMLSDKKNVTQYYKKYKSLFALEENSVKIFAEPLLELSPEDDRYQVLLLAMVKAGSPGIQEFLVETIVNNDSVSPEKKMISLGLMGLLDSPTKETMTNVLAVAERDLTHEVRNAGWLSVTNMARSFKGSDPHIKNTVTKALSNKSSRDRSQTESLETLHAAGNLGHRSHIGIVEKALASPALTSKQAALLSLRFMDEDLAQPLLIKYMQESSESDLVMTAFEAASFHELSPLMLQHLLKLRENAASEQLRLASLQLLKQKYSTAPGVIRKAIDQSARYDKSMQVRQFANSLTLSL